MMIMLGVACMTCRGEEKHPTLFFGAEDLPSLRQWAQQNPVVWAAIKSGADDLVGPKRVDPASLIKMGEQAKQSVRGHAIGRPLTLWLETLGFAYQITGNSAYGRAGAELLAAAARDLPPDAPPVGPHAFAGARGDILRAMAVGYDWLYGAMKDDERAAAASMMARYVEGLLTEAESGKAWWVPNHNFIGVSIGASGLASLALAARSPGRAPDWTRRCAALIERWLNSGFDDQGAYAEGVLYSSYGLDNGLLFMDALRRSGGADLFANPRLKRVPHFLVMSLLPGEGIYDAQNDSAYAGITGPQLLRLSMEGDGLAKWLWMNAGGKESRSPYAILWGNNTKPVNPTAAGETWMAHFAGRGLVVFRTGWDAGDVMFAIECGPFFKGTHNQADKGHFTLYGKGGRWAIDSGYGNNQEPEGTAQTVAHNCVLIDGKGQALSGAGLGTSGRILAYHATDHFGYVLADQTEAYQKNCVGRPGVALRRAHRHAFFVRPADGVPAYVLIVDDLDVDEAEHEYDWLLHTDVQNRFTLRPSGASIIPQIGASGGAFLETPEGSGDGGPGLAAFPFTVKAEADYHVWGRVRATGPNLAKSDSFFVRVDDGTPVAWHFPTTDKWTWAEVHQLLAQEPTTFGLKPGPHTLYISTREDGAQIDALYITEKPDFFPMLAQPGDAIYFQAEDAAQVRSPMVIRREGGATSGRCEVTFAWPESPSLRLDKYKDHPRLRATARMKGGAFVVLLAPLSSADAAPQIVCVDGSEGRTFAVRTGEVSDSLVLRPTPSGLSWTLTRSAGGRTLWIEEGPPAQEKPGFLKKPGF